MGLIKFLMKHSPGSPGAIARVMTQSYNRIRSHNPGIAEAEALKRAYLDRVHVSVFGSREKFGYSDDPDHLEEVVCQAPNLFLLILRIALTERGALVSHQAAPANAMGDFIQAIVDNLDKSVPGWRSRCEPASVSIRRPRRRPAKRSEQSMWDGLAARAMCERCDAVRKYAPFFNFLPADADEVITLTIPLFSDPEEAWEAVSRLRERYSQVAPALAQQMGVVYCPVCLSSDVSTVWPATIPPQCVPYVCVDIVTDYKPSFTRRFLTMTY